MISIPVSRLKLLNILNCIILLDLIFGGTGRVIMFGSISFRTALFAGVMLLTFLFLIRGNIYIQGWFVFLEATFIIYLCANSIIVGDKSFSVKIDYLSRYLYTLMALFYIAYFSKYNSDIEIYRIRIIFERLTLVFALFSIALWLYAFSLGGAAYQIIEYGFFRPKVYGSLSLIGNGIPRIFMKSSIFISIGLLFQFDRMIDCPSLTNLIKTSICAIAILTTFTVGFLVATSVCIVALINRKHIMTRISGILIVSVLLFVIVIVYKIGVFSIIANRFNSSDYSSTYRLTQSLSIFKEFCKCPILGHGFGYEFTTVYGSTTRTTATFEVAWGELLVDAGIIGFGLFVGLVIIVLKRMLILGKKDNNIFLFALGLIIICLESFTNPFINNSIGLTYFGICLGIVHSFWHKKYSID